MGNDLSPTLAHTGSRFAVAWMYSLPNRHPVVQLRLAREDATLVGGEGMVGPESHTWAELAAGGSKLGLCWMTDPGMKARVAFRLLSGAGSPQAAPVDVSFDYSSLCTALVGRPGGWAATVSAHHSATGGGAGYRHALVRLGGDGKPLGAAHEFSNSATGSSVLGLVYTGSGYLAAFIAGNASGGTTVRVHRFAADGKLVRSAHAITPEFGHSLYPRLVWTGGGAVALYLKQSTSGRRLVLLQLLDAAGQARGKPLQLTSDGWAANLSATWSGAEVALAWVALPAEPGTGPTPPSPARVMLARLRPNGTRLQPDLELARPTNVRVYRAAVAGSPRRLGVTWDEHGPAGDFIRLAVAGCGR